MKGKVITVLTAAGEFVGRCKSIGDTVVELENPRAFVQTHEGVGFLPGLCITGEHEPRSATFYNYVAVIKTNEDVESAWQQTTSGIVLP